MPKFTLFSARRKAPTSLPFTDAQRNAASIAAIPYDQFADAEARTELMRRALDGQDVYAYHPVGDTRWLVWIFTQPWNEDRHYPAEWALEWHAKGEPRP